MNVAVIFGRIVNAVKNVGGNALLVGKKYTPELAIGAGITLFGVTIWETVQATNKTNDILEEKERKEAICTRNLEDENADYNMRDYEHDLTVVKKETRWEIAKAWLLVGTTGVAGVLLILYGYKIINGRYVATAAAYKALEAGYDRYRQNVIGEFGEEVDWRMRNSLKADEIENARKEREQNTLITQENKNRKLLKKKHSTRYQYEVASAVFDKYSERWREYWTPDQVWDYLKMMENQMNDILNIRKHVFLNEVLDKLGVPRIREGQVLGWIKTRGHDSRISFGLDEMPEEAVRDFLANTYNEDIWIRLHFNVDGMILDMLDQSADIMTGN